MEDKILEELTCPITLELFADPITVPCCGKSFSRKALNECLSNQQDKKCPLCAGDLTNFDALTVQTNRNLLSFVELMKNQQIVKQQLQRRQEQKEQVQQQWSLTINKIYSDMKFVCSCGNYFMCYENREAHIANATTGVHEANGEYKINKNNNDGEVYIPIAEFRLNLCNSAFQLKESLFIIVVDKSGSMSGNPWKQVQTALVHIMGITKPNKLIKTEIITYASTAQLLVDPTTDKIKSMRAGGGTNFNRSFTKINEIIYRYTKSDDSNINNINICFLTDGQDTSGPTNQQLVASFRKMIGKYDKESVSLVVHSIGFSGGCDKAFLEELRTENGGTFRYAEPGDKDDELCNKLKSLFQQISRCSNIMIDVKIESKLFSFYQAKNVQSKEITIAFPVNNNKEGSYAQWVVLHDDDEEEKKENDGYIVINSTVDKQVKIPLMMNVVHQNRKQKMFDQWITSLTDEIATCIYNLANKQFGYDDELVDVFDLHCALVQQKLDILHVSTKNKSLLNKIEYLTDEIGKLRDGLSINIGHISDQRFGSKFINLKYGDRVRANELEHKQAANQEHKANADVADEILIRYSFNHDGKNRNELQKCIMTLDDDESIRILKSSKDVEKAVLYTDADGNNALLIACYCGRFEVVSALLAVYGKMDGFDINSCTNNDGETAITLAIKKRGYWRTIKVLLENKAMIPLDRSEALEKYAIANQYVITAKLIRDQRESSTKINESMSEQYIQHLFKKAIEMGKEKEIDYDEYLVVCLKKKMIKMVTLLVNKYNAKPTIDMLLKHCIPSTHNAPNVDQYLNLAKVLLEHNPNLINETNENKETPLYKACESGNVALVEYLLQLNRELVDAPNKNGNTPLYIACVKLKLCRLVGECYPCIIKELIKQKADVNYINNDGQSPIYPVTDRGNPNFAEILLSTNKVKLDIINKKGDSIVIHCSRLGHSKILELLLNHIEDKSFVHDYESKLNGFNALLSCVDAAHFIISDHDQTNREECLKLFAEYGVDLNTKAPKDNVIIPGGTALHLAAYYDQKASLDCLLSLGANVNEVDCNGQSALHIAVIKNHLSIIKMLRNANSNVFQKDCHQRTPLAYCQQNNEIKKVLMNPLLVPLMHLAKGLFKNEDLAMNVLKSYIGIIGLLPNEKCVNITDFDGNYPLLNAIIYGQDNVVKLLLELGGNPYLTNAFGVNSFVFANWIKNHKIRHLFSAFDLNEHDTKQLNKAINNLKQSCDESYFNSFVLHLSKVPNTVKPLKPFGIISRMKNYLDKAFDADDTNKYVKNIMYKVIHATNEEKEYDESCIERAFKDNKHYLDCLWHSKLYTMNIIASGKHDPNLQAFDIFFMNMYGNNKILSKAINLNIQYPRYDKCIQLCYDSLSKLPNYNGKTFIGGHNVSIDRNGFVIGATLCWKTFLSSACSIQNMTAGTILMIESKTGKNIAPYSSFAESEIILLPLTKFVVKNWYKAPNVAVATQQSEKMELLTNEEIKQYLNNQQELIVIQLEEI